jgi:ABC-type nitrate/sulfonate/bicarbonate transport system substrate-binding protein
MYAAKNAQEAYVNSLYAMNTDQLIAEVMRVQMEAAKLIQQEIENEREACAKVCEEYGNSSDEAHQESDSEFEAGQANAGYGCAHHIRARGVKGVQQ